MSSNRTSTHRRVLLLVIFLATLVGMTLADNDDAQLNTFYIINTDDPASGGCTPDNVRWLNAAYTEAMQMVRGAIKDIDTAKGPRSANEVGDQQRWDKAVSLIIQMFGVTPSTEG